MSNKILPKPPRIVTENNAAAAIISKMNTDQSNNNKVDIANWNIPEVSVSVSEKIRNNDNIVELFPDTELSIQILVSSIISPNDLLTTKINFNSPDIKLPTDIKQTLTATIKNYVESEYNIETKLPKIVREALFTKGAYIEVIIPEAAVDELINNYQQDGQISVEDATSKINKHKYSFLGNKDINIKLSLEDRLDKPTLDKYKKDNKKKSDTITIDITEDDLGISITDNPTILNRTKIMMDVVKHNVKNKIYGKKSKISTEDNDIDLDGLFKNNNTILRREVASVSNRHDAKRESIGKPLVMNLPTESVIPVHVVNDPTKHLGYFILLDNNGVPVDLNNDDYNTINQNTMFSNNMGQDTKLNMINKAKQALYGITKKDITLNNIEDLYGKLVEDTINKKLKNGMYGDLVEVKENSDLYRVMLMRALKAQQTRLLFLPKELVAYYAFDHRENGTGKSLLEKVAILYSIRAILLFTNLMATIKNNTTITEVNAKLEDTDADPEKTMEKIMSETLKSRQTMLPLGVTKLEDLAEWVHKLGFKYNFKHPGLPDMEITTNNTSAGDKVVPDTALNDEIKEHIIMSFGLTPEMVQAGYNVDFATTLVAKNLLLAKRVTQLQNILNPLIQDHITKLLTNDMVIVNMVKDIVSNNIEEIKRTIKNAQKDEEGIDFSKIKKEDLIEYITDKYINEMDIYLPSPELNEATAMKDAFTNYKDTITEYIDLIVGSEALPNELVGEISGNMDQVKNIMKTVLIKKWMNDNNYIPEVGEFMTLDDEGKPIFNFLEEYESYSSNLIEVLLPFLKRMSKTKAKTDEKLSKLDGMESSEDNNEDVGDGTEEDIDGTEEDIGGDELTSDTGDDTGSEETTSENIEDETPNEDIEEETKPKDEGIVDAE